MKFVLTREHIYPWPVTINPPDPENAGQVLEQKFNMTFRALPRDEAKRLDAEIEALPAKEQAARQDDLLRKVCIGWDDDVVGDDKKPIPFSAAILEEVLIHSWNRIGLYRAYRESLQGAGAQQGN